MSEKVLVPDIGEFENVEVIEILVKSGDQIKKNDPLITIESDKSSVEIPSTVDGKIESIGLKVGDKVSKGDLILNYLSSTITTNTDTIPKDTENIIKQAEEVIAIQKDKVNEEEIKNRISEKKQSIIQVSNGADIDPLETKDWLESLSAVISKDGNHRAHFLIKELINKAYREGANIPYTQNTPYINTIPPEAEVKDLFKENYQNNKIMHFIVSRCLIDGVNYSSFDKEIDCEDICVEVTFISISNTLIKEISNVLEEYQIKIDRLFEKKHIKNLFEEENLDLSLIAFKIQSGHNQNEIILVPKNTKKIGFFEKFFQLFS